MSYRSSQIVTSDPTLTSQYMLASFSPVDVTDTRSASQLIGASTRAGGRPRIVDTSQQVSK
jgi:hypothetical protein